MLAMLLAMTWTLSSWAIIPVAAVLSARIARSPRSQPTSARNIREFMDRVLVQIALLLKEVRDLLVGARNLDQPRHLDHAVHVRFFRHALHELRFGVGRGRDAVGSREQGPGLLLQLLGGIKTHQPDSSALRLGPGIAA